MATRTRSIPMIFRKQSFITEVEQRRIELGLTMIDIEELSGYHGYRTFIVRTGQTLHLEHFIMVCNLLDLDPRNYFELAS